MRIRWIVCGVIATAGCGNVNGTVADAPVADAPTACTGNGCLTNGQTCAADDQCTSGACACTNATCSTRACSAVACACGFNSSNGASCDGAIAPGENDPLACGASGACDGTGACGKPLLWYRFDEPAGTGSITNSGTWPGAATVTGMQGATGMIGNALELTTATDGVVILDPSNGSLDGFASWTVEAWINLSTLPANGYATLVKKDLGYICRVAGSATIADGEAIVWSPAVQTATWMMPSLPAINTWDHMACTYASGVLTFYWNGTAMQTSSGGTSTLADSPNNLGIGRDPGAAMNENLIGRIDDLKLWTSIRTDRQVCLDACGSYSGTTCTFDRVCGN